MKKAFSLIELLVVVAISAVLLAVAIPNYMGARQRARDAKKKLEAQQVKNALKMYYNTHQKYPTSATYGSSGECGTGKSNYIKGCGEFGDQCCPCVSGTTTMDFAEGATCSIIYMKKFPSDFGSNTMSYYQWGDNPSYTTQFDFEQNFCLTVSMENLSDPDIAAGMSRCAVPCAGLCESDKYCLCAD